MYCKLDENVMTPNNFSMNTILTSEKQKLSEDHEELKLQHLQLAQQQAATHNMMGLPPPQQQQKQQMLTTTDCNGNEEILQVPVQQQKNKKNIEDELPRKEELCSEAKHVHVHLDDSELWKKFKSLTNEMIVTKNGRYEDSY